MIGVGSPELLFMTWVAGPEFGLSRLVTAALVVMILPVLTFIILSLWVFHECASLWMRIFKQRRFLTFAIRAQGNRTERHSRLPWITSGSHGGKK